MPSIVKWPNLILNEIYIYGKGIEEIDINSWKDIEIQYSDGRCEKLEEHFDSPNMLLMS